MDFRRKQTFAQKMQNWSEEKVIWEFPYHLKGLLDFHVEIDIPGKFSIYNSLTAIANLPPFQSFRGEYPESFKGSESKRPYRDGESF